MPVENISSFAHYEDYLKKHKNVLVLYYWKDCGYCHMLAPIWNKAMNKYQDKINVMQIEWDVIKTFDKNHLVSMFPTITVFKNGIKVSEMTAKRDERNLNTFITTHLLPKPKKRPVKATATKKAKPTKK
jgi:thioredoxin-like negative regulator of GroEL